MNLRERSNWATPLDGVLDGATLQTLEGIVRTEVRRLDHDASTGYFEEELSWHDSYVAEQHVSRAGFLQGFEAACA